MITNQHRRILPILYHVSYFWHGIFLCSIMFIEIHEYEKLNTQNYLKVVWYGGGNIKIVIKL